MFQHFAPLVGRDDPVLPWKRGEHRAPTQAFLRIGPPLPSLPRIPLAVSMHRNAHCARPPAAPQSARMDPKETLDSSRTIRTLTPFSRPPWGGALLGGKLGRHFFTAPKLDPRASSWVVGQAVLTSQQFFFYARD